jgi:hypothetical protein
MYAINIVKRLAKAGLRRAGLEISRVSSPEPPPVLPPIFDDPIEAFYFQTGRGGRPSAFLCPLNRMVKDNGFSYPPNGYEPSVLAMLDYISGLCTEYSGSHIERYHAWRGVNINNALDNLIGVTDAPALMKTSKHVAVLPWDTIDVETRQAEIEANMMYEYKRHGWSDLDVDEHVPAKGEMEFKRCVRILEKISKEGFQRIHGDVMATMLKRDGEYRFVFSGAGKHRTAAMATLGETHIPASFHGHPRIIEMNDVEYWPQVRRNIWPRKSALEYFNHLFDFDSKEWARKQGLLERLE